MFNIKLSRRKLIKSSAIAGAATLTGSLGNIRFAEAKPVSETEQVFAGVCRNNCQSLCRLNAFVRNGRLVRTEMAPSVPASELHNPHPKDTRFNSICLRGLSTVHRVYGTNRLHYPVKQTKKRGDMSGFVRISWEQAIKEIGEKFSKLLKTPDGGRTIGVMLNSGNAGRLQGQTGAIAAFRSIIKGNNMWHGLDGAIQVGFSKVCGYKAFYTVGNEPADMINAKTIFLWGSNMAEAHRMTWNLVQQAKEKGSKIISVDTSYNITSSKVDKLIAVKPGSDTMVALAMMNHIIYKKPEWLDKPFMCENSVAPFLVRSDTKNFLRGKDLVNGKAGNTNYVAYNTKQKNLEEAKWVDIKPGANMYGGPKAVLSGGANYELEKEMQVEIQERDASGAVTGKKTVTVTPAFGLLKKHVKKYTPEYAEAYTGLSPAVTREMTEQFAAPKNKPVSVYVSYGAGQYYNSHHTSHALCSLGAITGTYQKPGACVGSYFIDGNFAVHNNFARPAGVRVPHLPALYVRDALEKDNHPMRGLIIANANPVNCYTNQKKDWIDYILPKMDVVVTLDMERTDTTDYSDYILPVAGWYEVDDIITGRKHPFVMLQEKAIEPEGESKSDMECIRLIVDELDKHMPDLKGGQYFRKTDGTVKTDWDYIKESINPVMGLSADKLKQEKTMRYIPRDKELVFAENGYYSTPSGRLEFYCEDPTFVARLFPYGQAETMTEEAKDLERLPGWEEPSEAWFGPTERKELEALRKKYPLQAYYEHNRWRVHSQWAFVPWLRELDPEPKVKISPEDAVKYGNIKDGDYVKVSNDRGFAIMKAVISSSLPQGILNLDRGWHRSQYTTKFGNGGSSQELTNPAYHDSNMNQSYFDALVKIEKV